MSILNNFRQRSR